MNNKKTIIDLSIVIPAYNEQERIKKTLFSIYSYLKQNSDLWKKPEVIVVSDGSTDGTDEMIKLLKEKEFPDLKLISYKENKGKGYAIKQGVIASTGNLVLFTDADGATPIEEVSKMAGPILKDEAEVVIASRRLSDSNIIKKQPKIRQLMGNVFSMVVRILLQIPFLDTQCGFKLFKGHTARELFKISNCQGYAFDLEIIRNAMIRGFRIKETGVSWIDGEDSKVNPLRDGMKMLLYTLSLAFATGFLKKKSTNSRINMRHSNLILAAAAIFLLVIAIRFFTLGMVPLIDPSEGRYAMVAKEMAETNDYITPMIWENGVHMPYWGKPPLYFWLGSVCFKIFGVSEFTSRLPAFLSAVSLLLTSFLIIKRYRSPQCAVLSILIISTCGGFFFLSGAALMDMTLTLFTSGALIFYYAFLSENNRVVKKCMSLGVFICLGLGFLVKGPVAILIFGLPVLLWHIFNKRWKILGSHSWITGGAIFLLITVPWFVKAELKTPGFLEYFFVNENFDRFFKKEYLDLYGTPHKYLYGAAILFFLSIATPWSVIALWYIGKKVLKPAANLKSRFKNLIIASNAEPHNTGYKFDLFFLSSVSIILVWCFSKQLHLYYLILAVPVFGIWLASFILNHRIAISNVLKLSIISLVFYIVALIFMLNIVKDAKSAKSILSKATEYKQSQQLSGNIVFVRKTPNSAYFHGKNSILIHPKESVGASLKRGIKNDAERNLYIIKKRYIKEIPSELKNQFGTIYSTSHWSILKHKENKKLRFEID